MSISDFKLGLPFPDMFPKIWNTEIGPRDFMMFRNLDHFKHEVSQLTQKSNASCDVTYKKALSMLLRGESDFPKAQQETIRNLVRSNLHKRGLITEEVYENFRYTTDGTQIDIDVGKYAAGEPDCVMTPSRQYIDFFYEVYVNISYPHTVTDASVRKNVAKILATIEELERRHVFIKITLVLPIDSASRNRPVANFFASIPLFSHKEVKDVERMASIVNERLLRKFFFAVLENLYTDKLSSGYGYPLELDGTLNIGNEFNEIEFFKKVIGEVDPE